MTTSSHPDAARPVMALVAHDEKKAELVDFCQRHRDALAGWDLVATGTTGQRIRDATGLSVRSCLSGPLGGDAQIAAQVAEGRVAVVLFIVDPLSAHPHDPDIQTLQRACNVHNVPIASNLATAELLVLRQRVGD